ncbi:protein kinase [Myxococcota bacterium]|nr:protein kinase [Myxococcota bacterium]MBU1509215.1 protein kinase [Myxococcota bacterium]
MMAKADSLIDLIVGGRFRVQSLLGEGGMGEVYLGRHEPLGDMVAIKVLKKEHAKDERMVARFRREARSTSRVQHRNVVAIFDMGQLDDGRLYLVMEYIKGRSLVEILDEEGALSVERAVRLSVQIADAMAAAHSMGIMHRDLKPENIVVINTPEGEHVKVLDFGLARMVENNAPEDKITMSGEVFGTPVYMSPEQCFGESLSFPTDVYSFGACFFELLTGEPPFEGNNIVSIMLAHKNQTPRIPSEVYPENKIPPELDAFVLKCLAKTQTDRFPTGLELARELRHVQDLITKRRLGAPADIQAQRRVNTTELSSVGAGQSLTPEAVQSMIRDRLRSQLRTVLDGLRRVQKVSPGISLNMAQVSTMEDEITRMAQAEGAFVNQIIELENHTRQRAGQLRLAVQDLSYDRELLSRQLALDPHLRCADLTQIFPYLDPSSAPESGHELMEDITFQIMELEKRVSEILGQLDASRNQMRAQLEQMRAARARLEADTESMVEAIIWEMINPAAMSRYHVDSQLMVELQTLDNYYKDMYHSPVPG